MSKNLLICFDAFGTLFAPKRPVSQQYAEVATSLGLRNITEDKVKSSFSKAFKQESKANPNYGKKTGMDAEKWWTNIINNTFKPLLESNEELPADLAPKLLHRFTSHEGYELRPGTKEALSHLRDEPRTRFENVVVGVITNSDPRVPDVLSSLGLKVSPLRYGTESQDLLQAEQAYHVDFSVMSYDVGVEKPNKKIFDAAVEMLDPVLKGRGDLTTSRETKDWKKIYVGDEYEKDVEGANKAGWAAVLISEEPVYADDETDLVKWAGDEPPGDLMNVLAGARSSVAFASVQRIADWLKL